MPLTLHAVMFYAGYTVACSYSYRPRVVTGARAAPLANDIATAPRCRSWLRKRDRNYLVHVDCGKSGGDGRSCSSANVSQFSRSRSAVKPIFVCRSLCPDNNFRTKLTGRSLRSRMIRLVIFIAWIKVKGQGHAIKMSHFLLLLVTN